MAARAQIRFLRTPLVLIVALGAALAWAASLPAGASAATIRVTGKFDKPANDGVCMLREAVIAANTDSPALGCSAGSGNDVILLAPGTYKLTRPVGPAFNALTGSLDVYDPQGQELVISGFGGAVTIDGSQIGGGDRLLMARSPLVLNYLTLIGGDSTASPELTGYGGAVATFGSALAVRHSLIAGSDATLGGGGILTSGPLELSESTVSGNSVDGPSGAGGGGIEAGGKTEISRSTVADNSVTTPDASGVGGGVRSSAALTIGGSILADNAADGSDPECFAAAGTPGSAGFNVIEHASAGCALTLSGSDRVADPGLTPIADNGGPTHTYAIAPGSVAENLGPLAASPSCTGRLDQRGVPRGTVESGTCDAGAYEISRCAGVPANVVGSPGSDTLAKTLPQVSAIGLGGGDLIVGAAGGDALCGGDGNDVLDGEGGADALIGGPGVDTVSYSRVGAPVAVTLDGLANDGRQGEGDRVVVESIVGGSGPDLLLGDAASNGILGGPGADRIAGGAAADTVVGQAGDDLVSGADGNDQVRGGEGNDELFGADGNDRLEGGQGSDTLDGGAGADRLFGGGRSPNTLIGGKGNDKIYGGAAKDVINCGGGRDFAFAGKKDKVARNCEKVKRKKKKK